MTDRFFEPLVVALLFLIGSLPNCRYLERPWHEERLLEGRKVVDPVKNPWQIAQAPMVVRGGL